MTQFADQAFNDLQGEGVDLYAANYTGTNIRFCISSAGNSERCPGQSAARFGASAHPRPGRLFLQRVCCLVTS